MEAATFQLRLWRQQLAPSQNHRACQVSKSASFGLTHSRDEEMWEFYGIWSLSGVDCPTQTKYLNAVLQLNIYFKSQKETVFRCARNCRFPSQTTTLRKTQSSLSVNLITMPAPPFTNHFHVGNLLIAAISCQKMLLIPSRATRNSSNVWFTRTTGNSQCSAFPHLLQRRPHSTCKYCLGSDIPAEREPVATKFKKNIVDGQIRRKSHDPWAHKHCPLVVSNHRMLA